MKQILAKRTLIWSGGALLILVVALASALLAYYCMLLPVNREGSGEMITVEIPDGASTSQIAQLLSERGVIRSPLIFRLYSRWNGLDTQFIAGEYRLSPSMELKEIAGIIARGDVYRETCWFTVPEGFTVEQIAELLQEKGLGDGEQFLELAARPGDELTARFSFLKEAAENPEVNYVLEGYLFPDTYEVEKGAALEEIVGLMLNRFAKIFSPQWQERAGELGLSVHQAVTLASIIEREAVVAHERERIASVFHNRLAKNYPLESCATVQYALGEVKPVLTTRDLEHPSPYNTYRRSGLPPGPIASPGKDSLRAALYPEESDYFFFVAKQDGSGEHYFSRTLSEHEAYKRRAEAGQ